MLLYNSEETYKEKLEEEKQEVDKKSLPYVHGNYKAVETEAAPHSEENYGKPFRRSDDEMDRSSHDGVIPGTPYLWNKETDSHQMQTENSRRFSCEHCEKTFTDPSNLQRHIRSQHMGARSHACPDCGKTFATSSGLKQHRHIHSSVKPFQCEVCLKAYTQFSNLCRHKRMHADCRQQIKCTDCGQAFSTITSLSKHKRFCEGALRNGIPLNLPNDVKAKLPSFGMTPPPSMFNPALYMRLYGGRPAFPFLPQMSESLSAFPFGNAFDAQKYLPTPPLPGSFDFTLRHSLERDRSSIERDRMLYDSQPLRKKIRVIQDNTTSDGESERYQSSDCESVSDNTDRRRNSSFDQATTERNTVISVVEPRIKVPVPVYKASPNSSPRSTHEPYASENMRKFSDNIKSEMSPSADKPVTKCEQPLDLSRSKETNVEKEHLHSGSLTILDSRAERPSMPTPVINPKSPVPSPPVKHTITVPKPLKPIVPDQEIKPLINPLPTESPLYLSYPRYPFVGSNYPLPMVNPYALNLHQDRSIHTYPGLPGYLDYPCNSIVQKPKDRYSCKFCGKIFPRSANLTRHLRTHTGEQPYKCKFCERSFSISSNLQRHVRNIHNKEKPFRCHICDRSFGQQTNLDRHLKKHETEGPNVIDSPAHDSDDPDDSVFEDNVSDSYANVMSDRDYCEDDDDDDDEIDVSEEDDEREIKTHVHDIIRTVGDASEHIRERNHSEGVLETDSAHSQSDGNIESDNDFEKPGHIETNVDKTVYSPEYFKLLAHYREQTQLLCS